MRKDLERIKKRWVKIGKNWIKKKMSKYYGS